jgi:hypothetical protein
MKEEYIPTFECVCLFVCLFVWVARNDESTWGISGCRDQPIVAVSANSHNITLINLDSNNLQRDKLRLEVFFSSLFISLSFSFSHSFSHTRFHSHSFVWLFVFTYERICVAFCSVSCCVVLCCVGTSTQHSVHWTHDRRTIHCLHQHWLYSSRLGDRSQLQKRSWTQQSRISFTMVSSLSLSLSLSHSIQFSSNT